MLNEQVKNAIRNNEVSKLFVVVTKEFISRQADVFDNLLFGKLIPSVREQVPEIRFKCEASSESYKFILPQNTAYNKERLIALLDETPLFISDKYGFGSLC